MSNDNVMIRLQKGTYSRDFLWRVLRTPARPSLLHVPNGFAYHTQIQIQILYCINNYHRWNYYDSTAIKQDQRDLTRYTHQGNTCTLRNTIIQKGNTLLNTML